MLHQEMKVFLYRSKRVENCSGFLEDRACCPEQNKVHGQGRFRQGPLLGLPLVSRWSTQIKSCPSKLLCHESGTFSHLQCCILNCQQTLIQSLVTSQHPALCSASDGCFPLQCWGLAITGSLILLHAISDRRMSKRFVGCAPLHTRNILLWSFASQTFPQFHKDMLVIKTVKNSGVSNGVCARKNHSLKHMLLHVSEYFHWIVSVSFDRKVSF